VYVDRVGGLITGLWRAGWTARALLVIVIVALLSPVVYILTGWFGRRWRRLWQRIGESRTTRDLPRRVAALRASSLRDLPSDKLAALAGGARWVYPRTGQQLIFAGAAQPSVYAVVEGALEGRAQGDPGGTVAERVGAGGVVGIGPAISGSPSPLSWYTAGTKLLAMPSSSVATAVGTVADDPTFGMAVEAQELFAESPALAALSYEDRLGLARVAVPISLTPGAPVGLDGGDMALLISAGVIVTPNGQELGRGTMIGPSGDDYHGIVATARTPVRLFSLPAVGGLPLLLGVSPDRLTAEAEGRAPGRPPIFGVHPAQGYAPLAVPPGPPPPTVDDTVDRRFEKRLRWLLILVLLLALLITGSNVFGAITAWAEMPSDKALLQVQTGTATAIVDGKSFPLSAGDDIYVGAADRVKVDIRSRALMTYRGGATSLLCAGTKLEVATLVSTGRPISPIGGSSCSRASPSTTPRPRPRRSTISCSRWTSTRVRSPTTAPRSSPWRRGARRTPPARSPSAG
jgi:putative peptide zinc metalloprotease protein